MNAPSWVMTVGQLNGYVSRLFAADSLLQNVRLKGEISNFKRHAATGHWYFTLKDDSGAISCVMFRQHQYGISLFPSDGMQVELLGSVGLYTKTGAYQFYATGMKETGLGDLYARFEATKTKLQLEGLFDQARKKPLPVFPKKIGIITSASGAVIHDIIQVSRRRNPSVQLCLCPATVQGQGAEKTVIAALRELLLNVGPDVIIIARGGGSMEDLWPFNEESLARAIAMCPVPVISAVGHETDFTIADFVADMRAPTPSAAAEIAVPDMCELSQALVLLRTGMSRAVVQRFAFAENILLQLRNRLANASPVSSLERYVSRLEAAKRILRKDSSVLSSYEERVTTDRNRLITSADIYVNSIESRLSVLQARLNALSPTNVLSRGYALVQRGKQVIDSIEEMKVNENLTLLMADGSATVRTLSLEKGVSHGNEEKGNV